MDTQVVLVVDDEPFNIEIMEDILEDDYDVITAVNGHDCLQVLSDAKAKRSIPDILLLDINMPGLDGIEVCKQLRADSSYDSLPIIFVSALASEEEQLLGYNAGANDYISKPFSKKELKAKVELTLEKNTQKDKIQQTTSEITQILMTNMTNTGELGQVLNFIQESYNYKTFDELISSTFKLFSKFYGLQTSILFNDGKEQHFFFSTGDTRPLEKEVLTHIQNHSQRMITFGKRIGFNSEETCITILVLNMPEDESVAGRLKDHLTIFIDALAIRLKSLTNDLHVVNQEKLLAELIKDAQKNLTSINEQKKNQRQANSNNFAQMNEKIEELFLTIGMDETQEETIRNLLAKTDHQLQLLSEDTKVIENEFNTTMMKYFVVEFEEETLQTVKA